MDSPFVRAKAICTSTVTIAYPNHAQSSGEICMVNNSKFMRRRAFLISLGLIGFLTPFAVNKKLKHLNQQSQGFDNQNQDLLANASAGVTDSVGLPKLPNIAKVTGAVIDETQIKHVLHVSKNGSDSNLGTSSQPFLTINQAFSVARAKLAQGEGVKINIAPGTYRESLGHQRFTEEKEQQALFIIEGAVPDQVIISGSDIFAPHTWKHLGKGVYEHDWPYDFGNWTTSHGRHNPPAILGHRAELVFLNGEPLKQIILEKYNYTHNGSDKQSVGTWTYQGFNQPLSTLTEGTFGVAERDENGNKIYIKLPSGVDFNQALIEVATRPNLMVFFSKSNLVVRNLVLQHTANHVYALRPKPLFDHPLGVIDLQRNSKNIYLDRVSLLWNNGQALYLNGLENVTVRQSSFNYNGWKAVGNRILKNVLWVDNETNFNLWRKLWGQGGGWFSAGNKNGQVEQVVFKRHRAIGNLGTGLWFDVHCHDISLEEITTIYNTNGVFLEISNGPFSIKNSLLAHASKVALKSTIASNVTATNNILYGYPYKQPVHISATLRITWSLREGAAAQRNPLHPYPIFYKNNLIVGVPNQKVLVRYWNGIKSESQPEFATFNRAYRGENNIFFVANNRRVFSFHNQYQGLKNLHQWSEARQETNSQWLDPQFVAPEKLDFRLQSKSPLHSITQEQNLPFQKVNNQVIEQAKWFFNWSGWSEHKIVNF